MPFIELKDIRFSYRVGTTLFDDFSASLLSGRVTGLLGPSGTGKTTILRLVAGLEQPHAGAVVFEGRSPVVTFVSQDPVLFEQYSRAENAEYRSRHGAFRDRFTRDRFRRLAKVLSLDDGFLDVRRPLAGMSGGQRQRLILLRELSIAPDVLLLDEPCTGLDPAVKREFLLLLAELLEELNIKCIYATHHFDEIMPIADEIVYLFRDSGGRCIGRTQGVADFLERPPTVDAAVTILGTLVSLIPGQVQPQNGAFDRVFALGLGGTDVLVVPSGSVLSRTEGFEYSVLSRSAEVAIGTVRGEKVIVASPVSPEKLVFTGAAYLFRTDCPAQKVSVDTIERDSQWELVFKQQ